MHLPGSTETPEGQMALDVAAEALTQINVQWLQLHPETPSLYESGIYYSLDSDTQKPWLSLPELYAAGRGDCEDIAFARAAELRVKGIDARPCMMRWDQAWHASEEGKWKVHWVVCLPDGTQEDPASKLSKGPPAPPGRRERLGALALGVLAVGSLVAWRQSR